MKTKINNIEKIEIIELAIEKLDVISYERGQ